MNQDESKTKASPTSPVADPAVNSWLTPEIRELLAAIQQPHVERKRRTVILLAFARANQTPVEAVFKRTDTCNESIWYMKWSRDADVRAAFDACYTRALEYADEETAAIEAHYRRARRQAIGKYAAQAPMSLAAVMASVDQRGSDRINAALALIKLADPETRDVNVPAGASDNMGPIVILPDNHRDRDPQEAGHRSQAPDSHPLTPDP
jgi:hypothetical protein